MNYANNLRYTFVGGNKWGMGCTSKHNFYWQELFLDWKFKPGIISKYLTLNTICPCTMNKSKIINKNSSHVYQKKYKQQKKLLRKIYYFF